MIKILLIEDDTSLREGLRDLLEINGYTVSLASDGIEGLKNAKKDLPDLIICDIMMPRLDGFRMKEILNEDRDLAAVPFIFLTAKAEMKSFREGMDLGADDYVVKPFDLPALLKVIDTRLKRHCEILKKKTQNTNLPETGVENKKLSQDDRLFANFSDNSPKVIRIGDIKAIEASGNYSQIYLASGKSITYRKSIEMWEKSLDPNVFIRIHRAIIINMNFIDKISKWTSGTYLVHIKGIEKAFTISQRYASKIRSQLKL
ncbi:MAG: LytR/AlgR family response regulator transcription factor [Ignavibacteriales bacterium]